MPEVPANTNCAPLIIIGSPRSGTTLLANLINRFLDVHISRDNGTLVRFYRMHRDYEPLERDENLRRLLADLYRDHYFRERLLERGLRLSKEELLKRVRMRTYDGIIEAILSSIAEAHGKHAWGYKRASAARTQGVHIHELFPRGKFIHIIRDARDVVLSMRNTPKNLLEKSWYFAAADWVSHTEAGRRLGFECGEEQYLEVRYEELITRPAEVLARILTFGCPSANGESLQRLEGEIRAFVRGDNAGKWRHMMPSAAVRIVERVAGPLLLELGYEVVNVELSGRPVSQSRLALLYVDRVARNLFTRDLRMMTRYRFEILKARGRARLWRAARRGSHL